jgi:hypothetical protein
MRWIALMLLIFSGRLIPANAQEVTSTSDSIEGNFNVPLPTLGGKQFWTDQRWHRDIRLQYNSTLKHYRIVDAKNVRLGWGSHEAMVAQYEKLVASKPYEQVPKHFVILVHGLGRTADSMAPMAEFLQKQADLQPNEPHLQLTPFTVSYASTRDSIQHHSQALSELIEHLPADTEISFVAHSLGNIVIRHTIGRWQRNGDPQKILPRLKRFVMLGPPNQGSMLAEKLARLKLFEVITGTSGLQLGKAWDQLQAQLAIPPFPFLIIVGTLDDKPIGNPLLNGPNDGVVTKDEAMLQGATQIEEYSQLHSFLMNDPEIMKSTWQFLISD